MRNQREQGFSPSPELVPHSGHGVINGRERISSAVGPHSWKEAGEGTE